MKTKTRNELLAECACFDLRKATRAVSRMYDDFLRDEGLNITQFSVLRLICTEKALSILTLGRYMVMERTSITRALAPLERDGLINSRPGADKRIRMVSVTNKGRKLIEEAEPKWRQAQEADGDGRRKSLARDVHSTAASPDPRVIEGTATEVN
jgi:DNA-binding MarR family transcriptional regulator